MTSQRTSICSLGVSVGFYWVGCADGEHISAAVDALWDVVMQAPGRLRNPYVESMVRAEFKDRLEVASRGELEPIEHVKSIVGYPSLDMFEIRWSGISLRERAAGDRPPSSVEVEVRLYYFELGTIDLCVVGCHAHEKVVVGTKREIRQHQDAEIETAVQVYSDGYSDRWHVPELSDS